MWLPGRRRPGLIARPSVALSGGPWHAGSACTDPGRRPSGRYPLGTAHASGPPVNRWPEPRRRHKTRKSGPGGGLDAVDEQLDAEPVVELGVVARGHRRRALDEPGVLRDGQHGQFDPAPPLLLGALVGGQLGTVTG